MLHTRSPAALPPPQHKSASFITASRKSSFSHIDPMSSEYGMVHQQPQKISPTERERELALKEQQYQQQILLSGAISQQQQHAHQLHHSHSHPHQQYQQFESQHHTRIPSATYDINQQQQQQTTLGQANAPQMTKAMSDTHVGHALLHQSQQQSHQQQQQYPPHTLNSHYYSHPSSTPTTTHDSSLSQLSQHRSVSQPVSAYTSPAPKHSSLQERGQQGVTVSAPPLRSMTPSQTSSSSSLSVSGSSNSSSTLGATAGLTSLPHVPRHNSTPSLYLASASALSPPPRSFAGQQTQGWTQANAGNVGAGHQQPIPQPHQSHAQQQHQMPYPQTVPMPMRSLQQGGIMTVDARNYQHHHSSSASTSTKPSPSVEILRSPLSIPPPSSPTYIAFTSHNSLPFRHTGSRLYQSRVYSKERREGEYDQRRMRDPTGLMKSQRATEHQTLLAEHAALRESIALLQTQRLDRATARLEQAIYDSGRGVREGTRRREALRRMNEERNVLVIGEEEDAWRFRVNQPIVAVPAAPASVPASQPQSYQTVAMTPRRAPPTVASFSQQQSQQQQHQPAMHHSSHSFSHPPPQHSSATTYAQQRRSADIPPPVATSIISSSSQKNSSSNANALSTPGSSAARESPIVRARSFLSSLFGMGGGSSGNSPTTSTTVNGAASRARTSSSATPVSTSTLPTPSQHHRAGTSSSATPVSTSTLPTPSQHHRAASVSISTPSSSSSYSSVAASASNLLNGTSSAAKSIPSILTSPPPPSSSSAHLQQQPFDRHHSLRTPMPQYGTASPDLEFGGMPMSSQQQQKQRMNDTVVQQGAALTAVLPMWHAGYTPGMTPKAKPSNAPVVPASTNGAQQIASWPSPPSSQATAAAAPSLSTFPQPSPPSRASSITSASSRQNMLESAIERQRRSVGGGGSGSDATVATSASSDVIVQPYTPSFVSTSSHPSHSITSYSSTMMKPQSTLAPPAASASSFADGPSASDLISPNTSESDYSDYATNQQQHHRMPSSSHSAVPSSLAIR